MKKVVKTLASTVAWAMLAGGMSGCAILHARSRSLGPPLDMPPPPARVVPIESQPIAVTPPTVDDVPSRESEPPPPTPAPPPTRVDREPSRPPRSEAPADAGATTTPAPPPAAIPPPVLQTTANPTEAEQRTKNLLENARRDLGRIDLKRLNREAQSQYQIARRFVEQAEEALRVRNTVFAEQLADKAATLAALLSKQ